MSAWSANAVTGFIAIYRNNPALWKIKSKKEYCNRNLRNQGYDELIEYCKGIGFSNATRDFVAKKIQSLRGAFRKELNKVEKSKKSGSSEDDAYTPSLWYFDQLLFTKDQELPTSSISNLDEILEEAQDDTNSTAIGIPCSQQQESDREFTAHSNASERVIEKRSVKKKPNLVDSQIEFMNVCSDALKRKACNEYEALGINFSKKLQRMNNYQAIYAETLIHSILRKGLLNELNQKTDICDKQCNKLVIYSTSDSNQSLSVSYHLSENEADMNLEQEAQSASMSPKSNANV